MTTKFDTNDNKLCFTITFKKILEIIYIYTHTIVFGNAHKLHINLNLNGITITASKKVQSKKYHYHLTLSLHFVIIFGTVLMTYSNFQNVEIICGG